jgi:glycosyltransferase involved in cell wall biosynthesis
MHLQFVFEASNRVITARTDCDSLNDPHAFVIFQQSPMESQPKQLSCSVIVCTRDRPAQLQQCLAGIAQQTLKPIEVIVVDNAPSESSAEEVAHRWGAKYFLESRVGLSHARNRGAAMTSGDVFAYIDDDALPEREWLQNLVRGFEDARVVAAAGRTVVPEADEEAMQLCRLIQGSGALRDAFVLDNTHPQWFEIAAFGGIASGSNMAFRRTGCDGWPGFDPRLGLPNAECEEHFAFLTLLESGHRVAYIPHAVVMHPTSYTLEGLKKRCLAGASYSTAYMLFLFFHARQHRRKLIQFIYEGLRGLPRDWRPRTNTTGSIGIPSWKFYLARMAGVWVFARSFSRSS